LCCIAGKLLFEDTRLWASCVLGPCTPYQYRLSGPRPWQGARDAILTQWQRVAAPLQTRQPHVPPSSSFMKIVMVAVLAVLLYFCFFA
jgi:dimethylaniline monooxygenase (N-oxide forming)